MNSHNNLFKKVISSLSLCRNCDKIGVVDGVDITKNVTPMAWDPLLMGPTWSARTLADIDDVVLESWRARDEIHGVGSCLWRTCDGISLLSLLLGLAPTTLSFELDWVTRLFGGYLWFKLLRGVRSSISENRERRITKDKEILS